MRIAVYSVVLEEVVSDVLQLVLMSAALLWRISEKSPRLCHTPRNEKPGLTSPKYGIMSYLDFPG